VGSNPIFHPNASQLTDNQTVTESLLVLSPNLSPKIASRRQICSKFDFKQLQPSEDMYPFKKARLIDHGGDLSKKWYIEFYAWDVQQGILVRKRNYEINKIVDEQDRRVKANEIIKKINGILEGGYHIDVNKPPAEAIGEDAGEYSVKEAIDHALEVKKPALRPTSYPSYKSTVELFKKWAGENRMARMDIARFDKLHAVYFDDYLFVQKEYAAKTVNGHIAYLKSLFQVLVDREVILRNPFGNFKKHKEGQSRKNLAFSDQQIKKIKEIIEQKDPELWLFIQFIYYCFLRPNEVRQLKPSYFNLDRKTIFIPRAVSKNAKEGYVTIPDGFCKVLEGSDIIDPERELLFPSKTKSDRCISKNAMGVRFRELVKELKLSSEYTLYSWKHSGVVAAYNAGVDIKTIQNQCRHQSLEQTDVYLKSLGLGVSQAINKIPGL
jgi:integrase